MLPTTAPAGTPHPSLARRTGVCIVALLALPMVAGFATPDATSAAAAAQSCGWHVVSSPSPGSSSELLRATNVSARNVWAVGDYVPSTSTVQLTLIEHWNGTSWSVIPSPSPSTSFNALSGISALSASNIWAVGQAGASTLVEHWNGAMWSVVPSPSPGTSYLTDVKALAQNDIWAVGGTSSGTLVEHWDGGIWSVVPSPSPNANSNRLNGITSLAANNVWAVGFGFDTSFQEHTLIEHWNGSTWNQVASPDSGNSDLLDVSAASATNIWAVGLGSGGNTTLVEHWDGGIWSVVPSPTPGLSGILTGVATVSGSNAWAVGWDFYSNSARQTLAEHWKGTSWSVVSSPNATTDDIFQGITAVSATSIWAVGWARGASQVTLVEHYACSD